jgi:propanediol utilization protein
MSVAQSEDFGFRNNQVVKVKTHGENEQVIENVKIRVNDKFEFDFHINTELGKKY